MIPDQIKIIQSHYNYAGAWAFLHNKGIELYGNKFRLYSIDADIIVKLIAWFFKDTETARNFNIDLEKGIMLTGPVGCGETSLLNVCRFLLPANERHTMKSCRDVSFEFMKEGHERFHKYTHGSFNQKPFQAKVYCFDDLGLENTGNFYGKQCSVMGEILFSRYDMFHSFNMVTHITTNLNSSEIELMYGIRLRSRFRKIFNLVSFDKNSADKRN